MAKDEKLPQKFMQTLGAIESLAEEVLSCRQEIIALDRRRNEIRMAIRLTILVILSLIELKVVLTLV